MVDDFLPSPDRPLDVLFVDFNAFFASCEQQEHPEFRGKPVAVAPVGSDASVAVAVSYEAKKLGIKTGTRIFEARQKCPELIVVSGGMRLYKAYHEALREVLSSVLPEDKVHSVDEMSFRLLGKERERENAIKIALRMKEEVRKRIGPCLTSSIGIAPNAFLAKIATEVQKPDGLVVIESKDIPGPLLKLKLTDLTGINKGMARRLSAAMIFTVADLYKATRQELRLAFGGIIGERWWYLLRGYEVDTKERPQQTLGHSNVLAPEYRNPESARKVLLRLLQKAGARLRETELFAGGMVVSVIGSEKTWSAEIHFDPVQDTIALQRHLGQIWPQNDARGIRQVGVTLIRLTPANAVTASLFDQDFDQVNLQLSRAVDEVNQKFGKNAVYLAGIEQVKNSASEKLAFGKTDLFSEGRNDNAWIDTFRGILGPHNENLPEHPDKHPAEGHNGAESDHD